MEAQKGPVQSQTGGGHEWYHCIDDFLTTELGLTHTYADHLVYVYETNESVILILLYVDNLLIGYHDDSEMECIKSALENCFKMVLPPGSWECTSLMILLPVKSPLTNHSIHSRSLKNLAWLIASQPLHLSPKKLSYVLPLMMKYTRPASSHTSKPSVQLCMPCWPPGLTLHMLSACSPALLLTPRMPHIQVLKHLLHYLKGSADYSIIYSCDGGTLMGGATFKDNIYGFTDSDYTMDPNTQCSVSGVVFLLAGGPVSWSSCLQSSISQSSTKAEYVASAKATKEVIWLCGLMHDLKQDISQPTSLFIDNHSAQLLTKNPININHSNTKHINI